MGKLLLPLFLFLVLVSCKSNTKEKVEVITLAKTSKSWNGQALPSYNPEQPEITILKISISPKTKLKWHKHPVINAGVLIKGELTVVSELEDTLHLKTGDPIVELVNTWHFGENEGNETAEILVFYAGTKDSPITIIKE